MCFLYRYIYACYIHIEYITCTHVNTYHIYIYIYIYTYYIILHVDTLLYTNMYTYVSVCTMHTCKDIIYAYSGQQK